MNRSESKYFATAVRMDEAFIELLEKKDFAYITVKEICEKAGVNRFAFYPHYETLNNLLEESAQYIVDQFVRFMPYNTADFLNGIHSRPLEELYLVTPEYLKPYLNYIKEHRRVFKTTVEQAGVLEMNEAYSDLNKYVFSPIMERFNVKPENRRYIMSFYISGLMAVISEWLKDDCKDSAEHIIIRDCVIKP